MPGEPLDQLRDQLDPGACRLANLPGRIWLFGGIFGNDPTVAASLREAFWRKSLSAPPTGQLAWTSELEIPENHPGWWAFSGYDDLLTFERDACHLARAIVLFPESPGSLAELGALAVDDSIVKRLLVVVQSKYLNAATRESFLNLGPLKRVESLDNRCVIGADSSSNLPQDDFEAIVEFVHDRLPSLPGTERLRVEAPTHRLLLTADLVDLLQICKPQELQAALLHFGVGLSIPELERSARLLEFFGLIRIEHRGSEHFLVRREKAERTWVDYTARDGMSPFDRSRFKLARRAFIEGSQRLMSVLGRTE